MNKSRLQDYYNDPFGFMDSLKINLRGNNLNIFQKYVRLRKTAFLVALSSLIAWALLGFDSAILQFYYPLAGGSNALIPSLLRGRFPSFADLHSLYDYAYGKEMHWSAFVIYGFMFWFLSRHFDSMGIRKSKNIVYTCSLCFLAISIFEFYWMGSYAYFQNQPWVVTLKMPQFRILLQNMAFFAVGIMGLLYIWADSYLLKGKEVVGRQWSWNWNWKALALIVFSVYVALVWWNWPFGGVQQITVQTSTGPWTNSVHFPQTLYTVDLDPTDSVNAGVWFYVANNLVHGWNTFVKIIWTLTVVYVARLKKFE